MAGGMDPYRIAPFPLSTVAWIGLTAGVAAVAAVCCHGTWSAWARSKAIANYEPTTCIIERPASESDLLSYRYPSGGKEYTSRRFSARWSGQEGYRPPEVENYLKAHPPGSSAPCWVNPADPRDAVLDRTPYLFWRFSGEEVGWRWAAGVGALALFMLAAMIRALPDIWHWLTFRPQPPFGWAEWLSTFYLGSAWAFTLIGLLLAAAGLLLAKSMTVDPWWNWWRAQTWIAQECTVTACEARPILTGSRQHLTGFALTVRYRFERGGQSHAGDRFSPWRHNGDEWLLQPSSVSEAEEMQKRYSPGSRHPCYVSRTDPPESFLSRDLAPVAYWFTSIAPGLVLLGLLLVCARTIALRV